MLGGQVYVKILQVSDDMNELVQVKETYPFSGRDEFSRGARNYKAIVRRDNDWEFVVHAEGGKPEPLPPESTRTPREYLEHVAGLLRVSEARVRTEKLKYEEGDRLDEMSGKSLATVNRLKANLAGFGQRAWRDGGLSVAIEAFDAAGILGDKAVQRDILVPLTSSSPRPGEREMVARAIEHVRSERQRTGDKMEDLRPLLLVMREFVS